MRPFAAMVKEFLQLEESTMRGIPTGTWDYDRDAYKEIATRSRPNVDRLQYALENEVHHRGQAFVYLRMLGIEPPAFYER